MLLSDTVKMKWNAKNCKRYIGLGYKYTGMGDEFNADLKDVTEYSNGIIKVKCDYCGAIYETTVQIYKRIHKRSIIDTDACKSCCEAKAKDSLIAKYGTNNIHKIDGVDEKIKNTNLGRYGCENPFSNENVKNKIIKTNIEKYGVPYTMQNNDVKEKAKKTCLEKYGYVNYGSLYSKTHTKELAPNWKGGHTKCGRPDRSKIEYRDWRKSVFSRDNYTCQHCGARNGNGKEITLEAHHLNGYKNFPDERFDIDNGITLCKECHKLFHSLYGKKRFTKEQF